MFDEREGGGERDLRLLVFPQLLLEIRLTPPPLDLPDSSVPSARQNREELGLAYESAMSPSLD